LVARLAEKQGVYLQSYGLLSRGAIVTGLLWSSILAFVVDRDLRRATLFSLLATLLSLVGLIHAEQIGLSWSAVTVGYLLLTVLLGFLHLVNRRTGRAQEPRASDRPSAEEGPASVEHEDRE
jgi:AGZA family xanthine/uracil permease-like MFS transporter